MNLNFSEVLRLRVSSCLCGSLLMSGGIYFSGCHLLANGRAALSLRSAMDLIVIEFLLHCWLCQQYVVYITL